MSYENNDVYKGLEMEKSDEEYWTYLICIAESIDKEMELMNKILEGTYLAEQELWHRQ